MVYELPDTDFQKIMDSRIEFEPSITGNLIQVKFHMNGHYKQFSRFIEKREEKLHIWLTSLYNEPSYDFYIAIDTVNGDKFYIGILNNEIYFNIGKNASVMPVKRVYEYIKNNLDATAEIWVGNEKVC